METLRQVVQQLRTEVSQFQEALELLETPQRYEPSIGQLPALDFLREQVRLAKDAEERERLSQMSRQTLSEAQQRLAAKEQELASLERDCEAIAQEMRLASEAALRAESGYRQALQHVEDLAATHRSRWQQLYPGRELYQRLGRTEFPAFVLIGGVPTLTTEAIARDYR